MLELVGRHCQSGGGRHIYRCFSAWGACPHPDYHVNPELDCEVTLDLIAPRHRNLFLRVKPMR